MILYGIDSCRKPRAHGIMIESVVSPLRTVQHKYTLTSYDFRKIRPQMWQIERQVCSFLNQGQLWADGRSLLRCGFHLAQNTELILVDYRQCVPVR